MDKTKSPLSQLDNKPERLEWLQDAGFGMFIHWSIDSQLGSLGGHSMVGASDNYLNRFINELPKTFNAKRFDPEEWAILAKLAGMKYMVFGTNCSSGFCMWNTKTTDFNIMNTPYGKDIVAEYVKAARKHNLAVGFYYIPNDFLFLYRHGIMITLMGPGAAPEKSGEYLEHIRAQVRELMTKYGSIDVMFIDWTPQHPVVKEVKEVCWQFQPDILITRGALNTPEQILPGVPLGKPWETCMTMGTQWQYKPTNEVYKSGTMLIEILIEARAKGGSLLLNVGPKPDGQLPIEQEENLREIALWNFVNGEAIHEVRPWIVTNEGNIWFTKKKGTDTVYAFITKMPTWEKGIRKSFVLKSVKASEDTEINVLGQSSKWIEYQPGADASTKWYQDEVGLHISAVRAQRLYGNNKWPNSIVLRITNAKPALIPPSVETVEASKILPDGTIALKGNLKDLGKAKLVEVGFQYRLKVKGVEKFCGDIWMDTEFIALKNVGKYQIKLKDLRLGKTYQFRTAVKHPLITMYGDIKQFLVQ